MQGSIRFGIAIYFGIALLTGCGSDVNTGSPSPASEPVRAVPGRNLVYVANNFAVFVYTYPRLKKIGVLSGFQGARGICANSAGDIFTPFIYGFGGTYEFPHGGENPIAFLGFYYSYAHACAVDPNTGNVAVIGGSSCCGEPASVTVYHYKPHLGWRIGKSFSTSLPYGHFCGYDKSSDLFCDGASLRTGGGFVLEELSAHGSSFTSVKVKQQIEAAGQIQWDGKHLAIGDSGVSPSVIYQFDVNNGRASKTGETTLEGSTAVEQFWIQGKTVVAPDLKRECGANEAGCIALYPYPEGGSATATLGLRDAQGAAVSLRP